MPVASITILLSPTLVSCSKTACAEVEQAEPRIRRGNNRNLFMAVLWIIKYRFHLSYETNRFLTKLWNNLIKF